MRPRFLALAAVLASALSSAADAQQLTLVNPPQSARVYGRDGSLIAELGPQVRTVVALRSLPAYVPRAFVAVEDRRFFEHRGVDPVGIARAIERNVRGRREGASTITQQLVGAMFPDVANRNEITLDRKVREARAALELEGRYSKERLLEAYLNQIYFGHGWYGIESAARHYFGKGAAQLGIEEAAMLAALPKGPGVYSPKISMARALERRNLVLGIMAEAGVITAAQAAQARARPIRLAPNHGYSARPSWAIEQVRQHLQQTYGADWGTRGLRVWTTIDPAVQNAADSALVRGLRAIERSTWYRGPRMGTPAGRATARGTPYLQGLVVSVDARTGEILAMRGGREWEESSFNRVTAARRQPGSSFKPIVYAAALESGVTAATVVQDTALAIQMAGSPVYRPENSDDRFRGPVTVREGLVQSINTVAIQLGMQVGLPRVVADARRYGITSTVRPYPSTLIGAAAVKPLELAGAYTAFANRGMRMEPFLIRGVADARGAVLFDRNARGARVLSPEVAFVTTDMLRDAAERGTGREARTRLQRAVPMAGKTGTTNDATDVWYVGYTPEIVTAVWVGFDAPRPIGPGAYGGTVAAPIWGEMMREVYARRPAPRAWTAPPGVVRVATDDAGTPLFAPCPTLAARTEWLLARTVPGGACVLGPAGLAPQEAPAAPDTVAADTLLPPPDTTGSAPPPRR